MPNIPGSGTEVAPPEELELLGSLGGFFMATPGEAVTASTNAAPTIVLRMTFMVRVSFSELTPTHTKLSSRAKSLCPLVPQ